MTSQSPILKEVDEEYRTTLINFAKYKLVMLQWLNYGNGNDRTK